MPSALTYPRLALAAGTLAAALAGCGSDDSSATGAAAPKATPAIESKPFPTTGETALLPGITYVREDFKPKVSLSFPNDSSWSTGFPLSDAVDTHIQATPPVKWGSFGIARVSHVFDPQKGGRTAADAIAAPTDLAAWLRAHPRLDATAPLDVEVGGLKGVQLDVTAKSHPARVPAECTDNELDCIPLFVVSGEPIVFAVDGKSRFYVLESDDGQVIVESRVNPASEFAKLAPTLDEILRSVQFHG